MSVTTRQIAQVLTRALETNAFRRLLGDAGWLMSGNAIAALLGVVTMALSARALGAAEFGALALIIAYSTLIDGFVNFQSWQSLIKFGADARAKQDLAWLKCVIKVCFLTDVLGAVLGAALAFVLIPFATFLIGWSDVAADSARWFCLVILVHVSGTPTGVLRLFGDYRLLAIQPLVSATLRLVGASVLFGVDGGFAAFVLVWALSDIVGHLFLIGAGTVCLAKNSLTEVLRPSIRAHRSRVGALLRFLLLTNASSSVLLAVKRVDVLIVGGVLGEVAAGLYRTVKMFAQVPGQVVTPIYQAVYPQLAKFVAEKAWTDVRRTSVRIGSLLGALCAIYWLGYVVVGHVFIKGVLGLEFVDAWMPGVVYLLGTVIQGLSVALQPLVLSFGRPGLYLKANITSNVVYVCLLVVALSSFGLIGAGAAFLCFYILWTATMLWYALQLYGDAMKSSSVSP